MRDLLAIRGNHVLIKIYWEADLDGHNAGSTVEPNSKIAYRT